MDMESNPNISQSNIEAGLSHERVEGDIASQVGPLKDYSNTEMA